jgi:hypothetical protein
MPTVDWSRWMSLTEAERAELQARYKRIIRAEIDRATQSNFRAMDEAMRKAGESRNR